MRNAHQENSLDIAVRTGRANLCRLLLMHCPELPVLVNFLNIVKLWEKLFSNTIDKKLEISNLE